MLVRFLSTLSFVALLVGTMPGCCCCMPGMRGPRPQNRPNVFVQNPRQFDDFPQPQPNIEQPKQEQPKPDQPQPDPEIKKKKKVKQPPVEPKVEQEDPSAPRLDRDPPPIAPQPLKEPAGSVKLPADTTNNPIRTPWGPGPIVAVSTQINNSRSWVVWNLQSMEQLGAVPGSGGADVFLSPSGEFLAMPSFKKGAVAWRTLEFFNVDDGRSLRKILTRFATDDTIGVMDFAGPDKFLSVQASGTGGQAKLWDVAKGNMLTTFKTEGTANRSGAAISPGGRYLATYDSTPFKRAIHIYDLTTGTEVGKMKPKLPDGFYSTKGMAFSHDGQALVILLTSDRNVDYLQAWDFAEGKRTADFTFAKPLDQTAKDTLLHPAPIEWLPDGSGWCAYGQLLIDRNRGNIFWTIPSDPKVSLIPRRWLDAEHYAKVVTATQPWQLEIFTLPKAQLDAARKK